MLDGPILAKDLAVEYKYLANTSEWFYIARKNAEKVIRNNTQVTKGKARKRSTMEDLIRICYCPDAEKLAPAI